MDPLNDALFKSIDIIVNLIFLTLLLPLLWYQYPCWLHYTFIFLTSNLRMPTPCLNVAIYFSSLSFLAFKIVTSLTSQMKVLDLIMIYLGRWRVWTKFWYKIRTFPFLPSSAQLNPTPTQLVGRIGSRISLKPAWAELGTAQSQLVCLYIHWIMIFFCRGLPASAQYHFT